MASAGMIFQCVACRALVVANGVVVEGARAGLPCSACSAINWLPTIATAGVDAGVAVAVDLIPAMPAVAPPSMPAPLALPPPPLVAPALAVPSVALVPAPPVALATTFDATTIARVDQKLIAPVSEAQTRLAARFTRLLNEQWHNDVEHKHLLQAAAAESELAFVGARYRAVLDVVREEPRARAAQQELIGLAMATMQPSTAPSSSSGSGTTIIKVVLGLIVLGGMVAAGVAGARWMQTSMAPLTSIE